MNRPPSATIENEAANTLEKYEVERRYRLMTGRIGIGISVLAIAMSCFHLYTAGFGVLEAFKQRAIHLGFVLALIYLLYPAGARSPKHRPSVVDFLLAAASVFGAVYVVASIDTIALRAGVLYTRDYAVALMTLLLILEAARRCVGRELPILAVLFVLYALFGRYIPGIFGHAGFRWQRVVEHLFFTNEGVFGVPLGVSATYIFLFVLFSAFLNETGLSKMFTDLSLAATGSSPGGPAKMSILASSMFGTISGSAVANVTATGTFTIPLMRRIGFSPHFAAAVEATASTGGQIMPPIMGAAAFIMAEFIGVAYLRIAVAAIIPALLYYLALWSTVHFRAVRLGMRGISRSDLPSMKSALANRWHLLLPLVALIYFLAVGLTPVYAAFRAIIVLILVSFLNKDTRITPVKFIRILEAGAKQALGVGIACAVVGFITGVIALSSVGLVFAENVVGLAGGSLVFTLVLTMVACVILGMGLPTSAAYIVASVIAVPALYRLGVVPMAAHLFVLYFAALSSVTPPVALAAYAGASLAGANPMKVGWTALRLSIAGFIIPFFFVLSPEMLLVNSGFLQVAGVLVTSCIGAVALAGSLEGYLLSPASILERVLMFASAVMLIDPVVRTDIVGATILGAVVIIQLLRRYRTMVSSRA
jgi:TRAP transporter 4TM/12TM fusion protein